jgi:HAD superfamily 5'-nucleotidase-like hydrolase
VQGPSDHAGDREAQPEGPAAYAEPEVLALLDGSAPGEPPRTRQIFVNRNLRMDRIEAVGFDMDYTLAVYHLQRLEDLAFRMTLDRMIGFLGYPPELRSLRYDAEFVIRGLVVDRQHGNLFKMDRHNHVGRCVHGRRPLPFDELRRLYRDEKIHLSSPRFAWIDSLFALPEACLFAEIIERMEGRGPPLDYGKLYDDIRESIDTVHRDGSLKAVVQQDLSAYLLRDADLGPALHKLRSGGKKIFLLTNSLHDYTDAVMRHLLDGVLPEYPSWRHYFDAVLTGARKPTFFSERRPLFLLDGDGNRREEASSLERGRTYEGGDLVGFERLLGISGERILYVGDHIYGDILRSKKSSLWRTCMVVEELERELAWLEEHQAELSELAGLEELRVRTEDVVALRRSALNGVERRLDRATGSEERAALEEERRRVKRELERLRRAVRDANQRVDELQRAIEEGYNRTWGLTFKEGNENSRFGEQIEDYACLYTSRASNFVFYSPMAYLRAPRAAMPHERATLRISPWGEEHAPAAAAARPSKAPR